MKLIILILASLLLKSSLTAGGSCSSSKKCQACSSTSQCLYGFSRGDSTKHKPTMCNTTNTTCKTNRTTAQTVASCSTYAVNGMTNSRTTSVLQTTNGCYKCATGKKSLNSTWTSATAAMTSACSATRTTNCTAVTNCDTGHCISISGTLRSTCVRCNATKAPGTTGYANLDWAATTCVTGAITNCSVYIGYKSTIAGTTITSHCYDCVANYAVQATSLISGTTCISYTKDKHCRAAGLTASTCFICDDGYWFSGNKCALASNIIGLALIALAALFFN